MDGGVSNAPPTVERSGQPAQEPPRRGRRLFSRRQDGSVRVYQHSNLLYWWPIWVWGYVCAGLTYLQGIGVGELAASRDKTVLFHPSPWLGISFIGVVLFVAVFTNVRLRGVYSFVLILVVGLVYWLVAHVPGIEHALGWLSLLRVHLNLAFYLTFSTLPGVLQTASAHVVGVQLTYLTRDGTGKAPIDVRKRSIGRGHTAPIVVAPMNDGLGLVIAEGIEDALSMHVATGLGAWAAGGAGRLPALARLVPGHCECVTISADNNEAGRKGAQSLYEGLQSRDIEVDVIFPHQSELE